MNDGDQTTKYRIYPFPSLFCNYSQFDSIPFFNFAKLRKDSFGINLELEPVNVNALLHSFSM